MAEVKDIQKIYETTVLTGTSKALEESKGGFLIGLLEQLDDTFNRDAGFNNGKYVEDAFGKMIEAKDHKVLTKAIQNLSKAMKKAYKGKIIGF